MTGAIHVVGAGLAGLAAAVRLAGKGRQVILHEAADHAGGRCRSYFDKTLDRRIDNGNHLLLDGNLEARAYLTAIGARDTMIGPESPIFPFLDLATGRRADLLPNRGPIPWWLLSAERRLPDSRFSDYLAAFRLRRPGGTVAERLADQPLYERLWKPLCVAIMNTAPEEASASLLWEVLTRLFGAGGDGARARVPRDGLSESFVDPALASLARQGAEARFGDRLRAVETAGDRLTRLDFASGPIDLAPEDRVIFAIPGPVASALLPEIKSPAEWRPIVNAHYRWDGPPPFLFLGLLGGVAEWLFARPGVLSVTISAADAVVDRPAEELIKVIWRDVARAVGSDPESPPVGRVVKEKRATFAATQQALLERPTTKTRWGNLLLSGDWTATSLPSTIEGAILSGHRAADCVMRSH
jgi:squalene-associated FAD-dependent desaturase